MRTTAHSDIKKHLGFTLIETVVALSILAVGILAIVRMFPLATRAQYTAAGTTGASRLAKSQLAKLRAGAINQDDLPAYMSAWLQENSVHLFPESSPERFEFLCQGWRASVDSMAPPNSGANLYRVTFNVVLLNNQEEKFVTYISEL